MALISDRNGATCAAGGESQVAGTLVGVSVGPADGARAGDLVRGRLGAPAGAPHTVRAQVLVQQTAPTLATSDPCARTCSTLCTLLRTVVNRPRNRRALPFFIFISLSRRGRSVSPAEPTVIARAPGSFNSSVYRFTRFQANLSIDKLNCERFGVRFYNTTELSFCRDIFLLAFFRKRILIFQTH